MLGRKGHPKLRNPTLGHPPRKTIWICATTLKKELLLLHCGVCYFENNFSFFEINDNDFKWKCESSYIITKKSLECMWYCAIYVCMIMKRKKIVLLAQKLRRKKLRIRKEFPIFVPDDPPDGLIAKKSSISFLEEKNYTQRIWRQDGMIFDDTEMFLFLFLI